MTSALTPVVYNGTQDSTLLNAISLNNALVTKPSNISRVDRFWSSQPDSISATYQEVLEIDLASPTLINVMSFSYSHFPQFLSIEFKDANGPDWQPLLDSVSMLPIEIEVTDSFPPILPDPSTVTGHVHPQHDYDGHWVREDRLCHPVIASHLRFLLTRNPNGKGPINTAGGVMKYSLALQNIDFGYRVASEDDIPLAEDDDSNANMTKVFANSSDIFGSNLGFAKKTYHPQSLTNNTDSNISALWKCEPQPFPDAVVNFYADVRTPTGEAQTINRIFVDPLYIGPQINLYYSNDSTVGPYISRRRYLGATQAIGNGVSVGTGTPMDFGPYGTSSQLMVDNNALDFDPTSDWALGIQWIRDYALDGSVHTLWDCGSFKITYESGGYYLYTPGNVANLSTTDGDSSLDASITNILAAMQDGVIYFQVSNENTDYESTAPFGQFSAELPLYLSFGANLDATDPSNGQVGALYLAQGTFSSTDRYNPVNGFISSPESYSSVPLLRAQEVAAAYNAILRFDSSRQPVSPSVQNPFGLIGGSAFRYPNLTWTPVPRHFEMQRGYLKFPPVTAKFWNLEITNLRPEPNDKFVPVARTVKTFPTSLLQTTSTPTSATNRSSDLDLGLNVQQVVSPGFIYNDAPTYQGTGTPPSGITNTQVYVADDYTTQQNLSTLGSAWVYTRLHPDRFAPRWNQTCVHNYVKTTITQTDNLSYFAGLRNIYFGRSQLSIPHDPPIIEEEFVDDMDIDTSGDWTLDPDGWITADALTDDSVSIQSQKLPTQTPIRALQFAALQSDAVALDVEGNFSDAGYDVAQADDWTTVGDGLNLGIETDGTGGSALLVSRDHSEGFYADIPLNFGPTFGDIEAAGATYGDLSEGNNTSSYYGGIQSPATSVYTGGRLYAAMRVTAPKSLYASLFLQIIASDTGAVIAEAEANVAQNDLKKWYVAFDLDQYAETTLNGVPADLNVAIRVIQKTPSNDQWMIQSAALFWDPIVWSFSCDNGMSWYAAPPETRNNPNGLILFPYGLTDYTSLRWSVESYVAGVKVSHLAIRPWYFGQSGTVPAPLPNASDGPNTISTDAYPPIEDDPRWQGWSLPVPYWWWRQ